MKFGTIIYFYKKKKIKKKILIFRVNKSDFCFTLKTFSGSEKIEGTVQKITVGIEKKETNPMNHRIKKK